MIGETIPDLRSHQDLGARRSASRVPFLGRPYIRFYTRRAEMARSVQTDRAVTRLSMSQAGKEGS
jgi:hypothetical protein